MDQGPRRTRAGIRAFVFTSTTSAFGGALTPPEGAPAAWITEDVPQCGYCQSGQIMAAAVLLRQKPNPTDIDINNAMAGNICRCGTYQRIRRAIHLAAQLKTEGGAK